MSDGINSETVDLSIIEALRDLDNEIEVLINQNKLKAKSKDLDHQYHVGYFEALMDVRQLIDNAINEHE